MIAIGSDVHKGRCVLAMMEEEGKVKMLEPIECTREAWLKRLGELPPEAEIALEVSTSGYFVMSVLEEAGWLKRAHWVHTAGIDSLRKQKSDRLDARRLARKLAANTADPLPEAWFPPAPIRQLRMLARQRCRIARLRVLTKNRINSLLQMHGLRPEKSPISAAGRDWIRQQALPAPETTRNAASPYFSLTTSLMLVSASGWLLKIPTTALRSFMAHILFVQVGRGPS